MSATPKASAPAGTSLDPVDLARRLIRCPSVTPDQAGALDLLQGLLEGLGFACHRLPFAEPGTAEVDNLYARLGTAQPNFCYAGHVDVVPVGDPADWSADPFAAELRDGTLIGRGAVDMKGAIAAYLAALGGFLARRGRDFGGSLSLLITADEEAEAINGTRKVLGWLAERGETLDACLVGEPTSNAQLGDMIKIGRRGSMSQRLVVYGTQGHVAYAHLADNPAHRLVHMLDSLIAEPLDDGSEFFPPSTLQITDIEIGNKAHNIIPARAAANFNIRFNDRHDSASLERWLRASLDRAGGRYDLSVSVSGESFFCPPGPLSEVVAAAVEKVTGNAPELGTSGGTSDARFIKDHCPVAELGLLNATAHKVDEQTPVAQVETLAAIYQAVLEGYFPR